MRLLAAALLLAANGYVAAQVVTELLVGKWAFSGGELTRQMDMQPRAMLEANMQGTFIYFREDSTYKSRLKRNYDQGSWSVDTAMKRIELISDLGEIQEVEVLEFGERELMLDLEMFDQGIAFVRAEPAKEDERPLALRKLDLVEVNRASLSGKWHLLQKVDPTKSPERSKRMNEMLQDAFVEFNADGTFRRKLSRFEEAGTWALMESGTTTRIAIAKKEEAWNIIDLVGGVALTLVKGREDITYYFERAE